MTRVPRRSEDEDEMSRDFFRHFDDVERLFERMLRDMVGRVGGGMGEREPLMFGYTAQMGPEGRPIVREFGNARPGRESAPRAAREPFTSTVVDDAREEVVVTAELPGVTKEDVRVRAAARALTIEAQGEEREYRAMVDLPAEVEPDSASATFKNGILDVRLRMRQRDGGAGGGKPVRVE